MHPIAAEVEPKHQLVQVVGHHQQHRAYVEAQGRPQGSQKPHFPLLPIQELRQIQKCCRKRQLEEIVAIPAQPAEKSFLHQLIFEQAQHQPSNEQPAHSVNNQADIPANHAVGHRSLPQQDGCGNDNGRQNMLAKVCRGVEPGVIHLPAEIPAAVPCQLQKLV